MRKTKMGYWDILKKLAGMKESVSYSKESVEEEEKCELCSYVHPKGHACGRCIAAYRMRCK